MDAARTLIPMFAFMLTPILIPVVVELFGRLSDGIGRRSGDSPAPPRAGSGR